MQADAAEIEVRWRAREFARRAYPEHTEKALQSALDITETQAERILAGKASRPLLSRMMARWGWAFATFALEPLCGSFTPTAVESALAAAEAQALAQVDKFRALRGAPPLALVPDPGRLGGRAAGTGAAGADPRAAEIEPAEVAGPVERRRIGDGR